VFPTTPPPAQRLLIFARVPELGAVKTRLARETGDARALEIYNALLRDSLQSIGASNESTEVEVMWAPTEVANAQTLSAAFGDLPLAMQTGNTLGERLAMAFSERFFFQRTMKIIAVGVDDPTLPRALIDEAFALLDSCEWVVGPAVDGGYYLIGCRAASFEVEVFDGTEWGTDRVLPETLARIRKWQGTVAVLPERRDIDVAEDLELVDWKP
jgi:rSAM/selenodomain-associated transferase 1